jgi:hypothetical protein
MGASRSGGWVRGSEQACQNNPNAGEPTLAQTLRTLSFSTKISLHHLKTIVATD